MSNLVLPILLFPVLLLNAEVIINQPDIFSLLKANCQLFLAKSEELNDADALFKRAKLQIEAGDFEGAKANLNRAIELNGTMTELYTQYGYIHLWCKNYDCAQSYFEKALTLEECNKSTFPGLETIAHAWEKNPETQYDAFHNYEYLVNCMPENADYLFYEGRLLFWMKDFEYAKFQLRKTLELAPQYADAAVILATILINEKRYEEARELLERYPDNIDAKKGLARIARIQNRYHAAARLLQEIVTQEPNDDESRNALAQTYTNLLKFYGARSHYAILRENDPCNNTYQKAMFDVKSHTNFGVYADGSYTDTKENDPTLGVPVVKTYYINSNLNFQIPIQNRLRLDAKSILFHQIEHDIFPPTGVNYDVYISGGQMTSRYLFSKDWKWDLWGRVIRAWGNGKMIFPFNNTTSFEPGTTFTYDDEKNVLVFGGFYESFIIKNFAKIRSELLRTASIQGRCAHRFINWKYKPQIHIWAIETFIHDPLHNKRALEAGYVQCDLPVLDKKFTASYLVEHISYDKLSVNYYSFKQQWRQTLGIRYHRDFRNIFFDAFWEHRWQSTRDLIQPIGDFIFTARKQFILANTVTCLFGYRFSDKMQFELGGFYYRDTLPYRATNIKGTFLWFF